MRNLTLRVAALALAAAFASTAAANDVTGAGATFVFPVMSKWSADYAKTAGKQVNYQSIGSGGGIAQIKAGTVDFGSTDAPMKPEELAKYGLAQFPSVIGGVVPVLNVAGVQSGALKLDGPLLADIFLGKVTMWNDPRIVALNGGVNLPAQKITVVRRSDGSGTTFNFVNYLSKVSPEWKSSVGEGNSVRWPVGIGGKGNEGVSAYVQRIKGSIGYVEYAYAKRNKMTYAAVQNRDGAFVQPDDAAFQAAAAGADWKNAPGFGAILTDQPGKASWPITGASFILMHTKQEKPQSGAEVLKFFDWAFRNGQKMAEEFDYVPLPPALVAQIEETWKMQLKDTGGAALWK